MTLSRAVRRDLLAARHVARSAPSAVPGALPASRQEVLEHLLYIAWFSQAGRLHADGDLGDNGLPTLVARLRAAHGATSLLEPGWRAVAVGPSGALMATRAGEYVALTPGDFVNVAHPGTPLRAGVTLAITRRRDMVNSDGWWVTSASIGPAPARDLARVYWNCPASVAPSLVAALTELLEERGEPYTLKCPVAAHLFDRVDSCVLYVGIESWMTLRPALRDVHDRLAHRLRPEVPPLTLAMGPGAALAEDPANGQSFGQNRVHAVADGLLMAASRGIVDDAGVLGEIAERLLANGIDPARPYQSVGSSPDRLVAW